MHSTCRSPASPRRRSPTARAVWPPTPESTSSNTSVCVAARAGDGHQREHHPRELAARRALADRGGGHAGVRARACSSTRSGAGWARSRRAAPAPPRTRRPPWPAWPARAHRAWPAWARPAPRRGELAGQRAALGLGLGEGRLRRARAPPRRSRAGRAPRGSARRARAPPRPCRRAFASPGRRRRGAPRPPRAAPGRPRGPPGSGAARRRDPRPRSAARASARRARPARGRRPPRRPRAARPLPARRRAPRRPRVRSPRSPPPAAARRPSTWRRRSRSASRAAPRPRSGASCLDLLDLEREQVQVAVAGAAPAAELLELALSSRTRGVRPACARAAPGARRRRSPSRRSSWAAATREPAVLVLAEEGEQAPAQLAKVGRRGRAALHEGPRASLRADPARRARSRRRRADALAQVGQLGASSSPGGGSNTPST